MNQINQVSCEYIAPNKTIETIELYRGSYRRTIWIYNYKGFSYNVFETKRNLTEFLKEPQQPDAHFNTEKELDEWLMVSNLK
jgi:hypothetical protein